jgi:hypothetical protein
VVSSFEEMVHTHTMFAINSTLVQKRPGTKKGPRSFLSGCASSPSNDSRRELPGRLLERAPMTGELPERRPHPESRMDRSHSMITRGCTDAQKQCLLRPSEKKHFEGQETSQHDSMRDLGFENKGISERLTGSGSSQERSTKFQLPHPESFWCGCWRFTLMLQWVCTISF